MESNILNLLYDFWFPLLSIFVWTGQDLMYKRLGFTLYEFGLVERFSSQVHLGSRALEFGLSDSRHSHGYFSRYTDRPQCVSLCPALPLWSSRWDATYPSSQVPPSGRV